MVKKARSPPWKTAATSMDKLCSTDNYPSDSYVFSCCGYDLPDSREQVADAFTSLPEQKPSILILRLVLDLTDSEIGEVLGLSRSAVQRRRTKSLNVLRTKLTASRGKRVCRVAGGPEQYGWQRLTDIATAEAKAKTLTSAVRFDIRATPTRQSRL